MRSLRLAMLSCLLALPLRGAETVTVKGKDYAYVPYGLFEDAFPTGWFAFRHDAFPWQNQPVMIPFGSVSCALMRNVYVEDIWTDERAGRRYIHLSDPVGSFAGRITKGYLHDGTDMAQIAAAAAHCAAHEIATGNDGLGKQPLFFHYGTLRQPPYKDAMGAPYIMLDGAIFSETYGQSAFFPSHGAKPPPMTLPASD